MPTYTAKCPKCGSVQSYRRSIAERNDTPVCCEVKTEKQMDAPFGKLDFPSAGRK